MGKRGFHPYFGVKLLKAVFQDMMSNKDSGIKEKIWAYKRGFLSTNIKKYGLTNENVHLYVSDFDYYRMYPINGQFRSWIDDKLTTRYILNPYKEYLPEYYCYLNNEKIIPLIDGMFIKNYEDIIGLLKEKGELALKLVAGSLGVGFHKIQYKSGSFYIDSKITTENNLSNFLKKLDNYIVTEYIKPHEEIRKIYPSTANTLRVMVINEVGVKPIIANGFIRFGTKSTGEVDNASQGALFTIVDVNNGFYSGAKRIVNNTLIDCNIHPDTEIKINGKIPNWALIIGQLKEIGAYLSQLSYMGFDIVITDDGFKILEINSHQDIKWYQYFYPLLSDNPSKAFFERLINEKKGASA